MEVHKHPHHLTHPKKWTEYLLEFFMLFLAVFLGFLAEYQLEHLIENQREKKYIGSMIQDLKTDTTKLGRNISTFDSRLNSQDSLLKMFYLIDKGFNQTIFRTLNATRGFPDFIYTDGTIQQLKNSGGFRLIRKHKAVDSIMAYDAEVKKALINEDGLSNELYNLRKEEDGFFDYNSFDNEIRQGKSYEQMEQEKFNYLFTTDKIALSKFYNNIRYFNWLYNIVKQDMERVKFNATRLIKFLQSEYHLEDE